LPPINLDSGSSVQLPPISLDSGSSVQLPPINLESEGLRDLKRQFSHAPFAVKKEGRKKIRLEKDGPVSKDGQVLSSQYGIIKRILSFLPFVQLKKCQRVCRNWKNVGNLVLRERNKGQPKVFYWRGVAEIHTTTAEVIKTAVAANSKDVKEKLSVFREEIMFEPALIIVFSTTGRFGGVERDYWVLDIQDVTDKFPTSLAVGAMNRGVIGSSEIRSTDGSVTYAARERDNMELIKPVLSMICVPKWPGVDFKQIKFPSASVNNPTSLAASLVLVNSDIQDMQISLSSASFNSLFESNPEISLGGGLVNLSWSSTISNDLEYYQNLQADLQRAMDQYAAERPEEDIQDPHDPEYYEGMHMAVFGLNESGTELAGDWDQHRFFSGLGLTIAGSSVKSATVVIGPTEKSVEDIERKLMQAKDCIEEKNSFGLKITCFTSRDPNFHEGRDKSHWESKIFNKLFPSTPLVGLITLGEIGMTRPWDEDMANPPDFFHTHTTFFIIISRSKS